MNDFKSLLDNLNLTTKQCADLVGVSTRTVRNWKSKATNPPKSAIMLLEQKKSK